MHFVTTGIGLWHALCCDGCEKCTVPQHDQHSTIEEWVHLIIETYHLKMSHSQDPDVCGINTNAAIPQLVECSNDLLKPHNQDT